ncbi:MAG: sulfatase [Halioglobus sp.]
MIKHLFKSFFTVTVVTLLVIAIWLGYRYASFEQLDDNTHLEAKTLYLEHLASSGASINRAPNILFILYDDMGYGDIGAGETNADLIDTPNIDALAASGLVLSDFHSPAPVCTPSRAGYLTGRLAPRAGLPDVVFPSGSTKEFISRALTKRGSHVRLPAEEITLADVLKASGYRTGMVGKWHLGDRSPSLPNDFGFDHYFGALYSNDMEPFALYRNQNVEVQAPVDQRYLSERYTEQALAFLRASDDKFFLYFAHNFPHDPLHAREERLGTSDGGLYGDVLEEIDEGVGALVQELRDSGRLDNTLIIISSDNGPWYLGNAGAQRGRKGNTFEGGMRVPFIAHWPAAIPAGRSEPAMAMGIDLMPTILEILQLPPPNDRVMDGRSMLAMMTEGTASAHQYLHYYDGETLFAVRDQRFKYRGAAGVFYGTDQMPISGAVPQKEWLFDLQSDPGESYDVSARHPQKLAELRTEFNRKKAEMQANLRGWHR